MNQVTLAWGALRNLTRTAARDPVWAITAVVLSPVRLVRNLLGITFAVLAVAFVLALLSEAIPRELWYLRAASGIVVLGVPLVLAFRLLTNPLIEHFGDQHGDTHGSARFATQREIAPLTRADTGLLVGRDQKTGKLLRYDGPAHLLTMAPTRTGKGVGTIIPNLLTAERAVICIDPKGENAKVAGRAREGFGPVHVLDPFGVTGRPSAAFNPLDGLDPAGLDAAEDASTLADALVFDEPGQARPARPRGTRRPRPSSPASCSRSSPPSPLIAATSARCARTSPWRPTPSPPC